MDSVIYNRFILILVVIITFSCKTNYQEPVKLFENTKSLEDKVFFSEEDILNKPLQIINIGDQLLILDKFEIDEVSKIFMAINSESGKVQNNFGRIGRGPQEFLFPSFLSKIHHQSNVFGIYNAQLFTFSIGDLESIESEKNVFIQSVYPEFDTRFSKITPVNSHEFIGSGFFKEGRYAIADTTGKIKDIFGTYPFEKKHELPRRVLGMAYQSIMEKHPQKPIFCSVTSRSANLEIFRYQNGKFEVLKKVNSFPAKFENNSGNNRLSVSLETENKMGYMDMTVTNDSIYLLYSGKTMDQNYRYADDILVFNWEGEPIIHYKVNSKLKKIAINNENELYGITKSANNEYSILKYSIPAN